MLMAAEPEAASLLRRDSVDRCQKVIGIRDLKDEGSQKIAIVDEHGQPSSSSSDNEDDLGAESEVEEDLPPQLVEALEKRIAYSKEQGQLAAAAAAKDEAAGKGEDAKDVALAVLSEFDLPLSQRRSVPVDKEGWLSKASSTWLPFMDGWTWRYRWFRLCDGRLSWYMSNSKEDLQQPMGCLDFALVNVQVERFWSEREDGKRPGQQKSRCWCLSSAASQASQPRFRICPQGSDRAFEMQADTLEDARAWVDALAQHITKAEEDGGSCGGPRSVHDLQDFGKRWWKVTRISCSQFESVCDSGDILLFRSRNSAARMQRMLTGGRFDHVGLILKLSDRRLAIIEATSDGGVGIVTWKEFLFYEWEQLYSEIAVRRLHFKRSSETMRVLQNWARSVVGKPYKITIEKLRQRESVGSETEDYFCSQLVAQGLKRMTILQPWRASSSYWPNHFETNCKTPLQLMPGVVVDAELSIDFTIPFTRPSQADVSGAMPNRGLR